jgi:hypothetical protein
MAHPPGQQQGGYDAEQEYAECRISQSGAPHDRSEGGTGSPQVNEMLTRTGRASPALGPTDAALTRELFHKRHALFLPAKARRKTPVSLKLTGNYRVITM